VLTAVINLKRSFDEEKNLVAGQVLMLCLVGLSGLGVALIEFVRPSFFSFPYFYWGGWEAVAKFWPLFVWAIALHLALHYLSFPDSWMSMEENKEQLSWDLLTSTLAGIWEELGYRFFFVCYAMIGIWFLNFVFSMGLAVVLALALAGLSFYLVLSDKWSDRGWAAVALLGAAAVLWLGYYADPVYWIHYVMKYIVYWTTLFQMESVLYGNHDALFIFGAIVANAWFRDGHKYQGPLGIVNSWYGGMILLYATVTYGLLTAIVVHALYNIIISVLRFILTVIDR
jgi:hypothetical protein